MVFDWIPDTWGSWENRGIFLIPRDPGSMMGQAKTLRRNSTLGHLAQKAFNDVSHITDIHFWVGVNIYLKFHLSRIEFQFCGKMESNET